MKKFLVYFSNEWLVKHVGWYEGYLEDSPSTNNGLESINSTLKKESTLRNRMQMSEFLKTTLDVAKNWSLKRDPTSANHPKKISREPTVTTSEFTSAYNWLKEVTLSHRKVPGSTQYFFKSKRAATQITKRQMKEYCGAANSNYSPQTFDEYHRIFFSMWCVEFPANANETSWKEARCSSPTFQKNYIYKHIIGIAARLKLVTIPNLAKNVPIGEKRKRGRPTLARKALEIQPEAIQERVVKETSQNNIQPTKKRGRPSKSKSTAQLTFLLLNFITSYFIILLFHYCMIFVCLLY